MSSKAKPPSMEDEMARMITEANALKKNHANTLNEVIKLDKDLEETLKLEALVPVKTTMLFGKKHAGLVFSANPPSLPKVSSDELEENLRIKMQELERARDTCSNLLERAKKIAPNSPGTDTINSAYEFLKASFDKILELKEPKSSNRLSY